MEQLITGMIGLLALALLLFRENIGRWIDRMGVK